MIWPSTSCLLHYGDWYVGPTESAYSKLVAELYGLELLTSGEYCQNIYVEREISEVERPNLNRGSPASNCPCYCFEVGHFHSLHDDPVHSALQTSAHLIWLKYASEYYLCRNCSMAECFPDE